MGEIVRFPGHFGALARTPKTEGSARKRSRSKTREKISSKSEGMRLRDFQLVTACTVTSASSAAAFGPPTALMTCSTELSMAGEYTRSVYSSRLHGPEIEDDGVPRDNWRMDDPVVIKRRLRDAAAAVGLNNAQFAESLGITPQRWWNIYGDKGPNDLAVELAVEMRRVHGFSLDWIYCGELSHLPTHLRDKILEIERKRQTPAKRAAK